jgi:tetratricopeptide (TPR) repeat protein
VSELLFKKWQRKPDDIGLLSRWVAQMQQKSQQQQAIERLRPCADQSNKAVSASVYAALINLALEIDDLPQTSELVAALQQLEPESYRPPYFQGLLLARSDQKNEAKAYFLQALERDADHKASWKALVDCCTRTRDFEQGLVYIQRALQQNWPPRWRRYWLYKQACIFQQMGRFSLGLVTFTQVVLDCVFTGMPEFKQKKARLSQLPASAPLMALNDAVAILENVGLQPFPTAGTLLGWWREGKFMLHDKDVDIMLPPGTDWSLVTETAENSSKFRVIPSEMGYLNLLSLSHLETKVCVDVTQHEEGGTGQVKCVWRIPDVPEEQCRRTLQSGYQLVRDQWLGSEFWRPEDPDRFLTEMYGDWRTPVFNFDTVISGEHLVGFPDMVRCYAYNRLANALSEGNVDKALGYVQQILNKDPLDPLALRVRSLLPARQKVLH